MTGLISWLVGTSQGPGDAVIRQNISDLKKLQAHTAIMIYIGCFENCTRLINELIKNHLENIIID